MSQIAISKLKKKLIGFTEYVIICNNYIYYKLYYKFSV